MPWIATPSLESAASLSLACDYLDALKSLEEGWDSYSAQPPNATAIENAKRLVLASARASMLPDRIEPSAMGGVGITFSRDRREVVVEFYNGGTAHALFVDEATADMNTQPVPTTQAGLLHLLKDARAYLYGE